MKKIYFSLLTLLAGLSAQAQLTQANHAPENLYTYQTYQCDSTGINPGASGAGANWNFSTIATHSNVLLTYVTSTVNNASYPTATIAVAAGPNNTSYYNSTSGALNYFGGNITVGSGGQAVIATLNYTSAAVVAVYPMSLNTATSMPVSGTVNVTSPLPTTGTFSGTCSVKADGSGTITLPGTNTTFTNALRVVTSQTLDVTTSFAAANVIQVVYDYYSIGTRNPIFSISTSTATILGSSSTRTVVTRDKNASANTTTTTVSINETSASVISINVYPNPSSSYVQFTTDSPDARTVSVYDITGKLITKENFADGKIKLDVSELNTGLYMYTVSGTNNRTIKTGKVTVNH